MIQHVQHTLIQHKVYATRLYSTAIQQKNLKIRQFQKRVKEKVKERQFNTTHNTTRIQKENIKLNNINIIQCGINIAQKIQHKVGTFYGGF